MHTKLQTCESLPSFSTQFNFLSGTKYFQVFFSRNDSNPSINIRTIKALLVIKEEVFLSCLPEHPINKESHLCVPWEIIEGFFSFLCVWEDARKSAQWKERSVLDEGRKKNCLEGHPCFWEMFSLIFQSNHSNKTHPPMLFNTRKLNDLVVIVGREENSGCLNQIHVFLKQKQTVWAHWRNKYVTAKEPHLVGFKKQISISSCDLEGVAVGDSVGADLPVGEGLQRLGFALLVQRHGCGGYTEPQFLWETPGWTL